MHLSVSSVTPVPDLLDNIVNVLMEHSSSTRLRRVDETRDSFQSDFSISFDDFEQLNNIKRALRSMDGDLEVSFLDNRIA